MNLRASGSAHQCPSIFRNKSTPVEGAWIARWLIKAKARGETTTQAQRQITLETELLRMLEADLAADNGSRFVTAMQARELIDGGSFGPEALKAIGKAFDAAWTEIEGAYGTDPAVIEAGRFKLANMLLSIANEQSRDVETLKRAALERVAARTR